MPPDETTFCFRCHYDLRGVADDQPCPECGLLAERSRRPTDALRDARPKWLRSLSIGVWLMIVAILLATFSQPLGQLLFSFLEEHWRPPAIPSILPRVPGMRIPRPAIASSWNIYQWEPVIYAVGWELATVVVAVGAFLLTRPEGFEPADRLDRRRRTGIRAAAMLPILAAIVAAFAGYQRFMLRNGLFGVRQWDLAVVGLVTLGCLPLPALGFAQLKSLARRAGSRHLSEHCSIVGWGTSCTLVLAFGFYLLQHEMESGGADWMGRSTVALLLLLAIGTSMMLFALWSLYLMIRFAISFGRASGESHRAWRAADRSQPAA